MAGNWEPLLDEVEEFLVGTRRAGHPDRALATVLFTDIVGSTERTAALGDSRWRDLIATHDATVRDQLRVYQGREIKTMGDGFLATFDGPARAVRCAREIRDLTHRLGIKVRAGIHTGEVELTNNDIAGMGVNIGARIGALAGAGEVLVSGTVKTSSSDRSSASSSVGCIALRACPASGAFSPFKTAVCRRRSGDLAAEPSSGEGGRLASMICPC